MWQLVKKSYCSYLQPLPKKDWVQKKLGSKNFLLSKKFGGPTNFWSKKMWFRNTLVFKKNWCKKCRSKNVLVQSTFRPERILFQKIFGSKIFLRSKKIGSSKLLGEPSKQKMSQMVEKVQKKGGRGRLQNQNSLHFKFRLTLTEGGC